MTFNIGKGYSQPVNQTIFEKALVKMIELNFPDPKNFTIIAERRKYRVREDQSIFNQNIGKAPEVADIYYKNEFVCDVSEDMQPQLALFKIKQNLKEVVKSLSKI